MRLEHLDENGPKMVDVSDKATTKRHAVAVGKVRLGPDHLAAMVDNPKGDVFQVARLAGIQAAKKCSDLIPLCHPIRLSHAEVTCELSGSEVLLRATATALETTGVEMEALTAVAVAGLTVIDMLKSAGLGLELTDVKVESKSGGKSDYGK